MPRVGSGMNYGVQRWLVWRRAFFFLMLCGLPLHDAAAVARPVSGNEPTVEELKARIAAANTGDKVHLCVQVAEKQLAQADSLYSAGDIEKGQTALTDVTSFAELARDYSIQSKKHQKQTEIAVRGMTRKLSNILHTLGQGDQAAVKDAINRLERVRDDLLASMFTKGTG